MQKVAQNSPKAWLLAARPKTLSAALSPVLIASALAFQGFWGDNGQRTTDGCSQLSTLNCQLSTVYSQLSTALLCLLFAALMQIAANFINDYFDFKKGTDGEDRLGPERACAQGWVSPRAMKWAIGITLTLASLTGLGILVSASSLLVINFSLLIALGLACIVFAFLYTTLLSYCGGGDLLVWVFFGLVPVLGTYYVLTGTVVPEAVILAAATGLVTDTLLVLNNYRDRDTDRASGKRTLIVALGERFGEQFYLWQGILGAALAAWGTHGSLLPLFCLYLLAHVSTWSRMRTIYKGKALNAILGRTSLNMLVFTLCTILAIII